jgi:hypothetical protein
MAIWEDTTEGVMDWLEKMDQMGPFAALDALEAGLSAAPATAKKSPEYHYLRGMLDGRAVHEYLGGIDVDEKNTR